MAAQSSGHSCLLAAVFVKYIGALPGVKSRLLRLSWPGIEGKVIFQAMWGSAAATSIGLTFGGKKFSIGPFTCDNFLAYRDPMFRKNSAKTYRDALGKKRKALVSAIPRRVRSKNERWLKPGWKFRLFPRVGGRAARLLWLCGCLALLGFAFLNAEMDDQEVVFVYGMMALSFPAGVLVAAGFAFFIKATFLLTGMTVPSCFAFDLLMWPFFVAAGYLQWFVAPRWIKGIFRRKPLEE
jgi:hypothetical protein